MTTTCLFTRKYIVRLMQRHLTSVEHNPLRMMRLGVTMWSYVNRLIVDGSTNEVFIKKLNDNLKKEFLTKKNKINDFKCKSLAVTYQQKKQQNKTKKTTTEWYEIEM